MNYLKQFMIGGLMQGVFLEGERVRVKLLRSNFEIWFEMPNSQTAADIKQREGDKYAIPIGIRLVNGKTGKDVRGFSRTHLNPWWVRMFVLDIAAAVAYIEREWDVMSEEYVKMMEEEYVKMMEAQYEQAD